MDGSKGRGEEREQKDRIGKNRSRRLNNEKQPGGRNQH
jgi:hypothetical protein